MGKFFRVFFSICFCFTLFLGHTSAQKEGNIWYFGKNAGIDFNTGAAFALVDGAMNTLNGCATISDATGKLLFYTNGIEVYDRTHNLMPNGTGLAGGLTSTQSAIIIPKPFNTTLYYIFTVDNQMGSAGIEYSIVDMSQNAYNGDVVKKNIKIRTPVCEKLTAVQHFNKKDIWVIAHNDSDSYISFLVTDSGVRTTPVISPGGVSVAGSKFDAIGYLKVSSEGNRLASAIKLLNLVEIGSFDNTTGKVGNLQVIPNVSTAYGVEFSPDNTKLYATDYFDRQLYQFDLSSNDINTITNSRVTIFTSTSALSAIQQAPDGKIYVSRDAHGQMGVISDPDQLGLACNYNDIGFDLNGKECYAGLPTFVQSFFLPTKDFIYQNTCLGDGTEFIGKTNINPDYWYWYFDDPVSTIHNTDSSRYPVHYFSSAGTYHVYLVIGFNGATDTVRKTLTINNISKINLGGDRSTCLGLPVRLDAGISGVQYQWNTGDTTRAIQVDTSGRYWVTASKDECVRSDTVRITFLQTRNYSLGNDTVVCGTSLTLSKNVPGAHILWSTGETDTSITVHKTGYYWIRISTAQCSYYDTILVFFESPPPVYLGPDTTLCEGNIDTLNAGIKFSKYLWSTGEITQKIAIHSGGTYWVRVTASNCIVYDTINVLHCRAKIFIPDAFTPNGDSLNDRFRPYGSDIARAQMTIVNRWGEIVYKGDDENGWDGKFGGSLCPEGLYEYVVIYREYLGTVLYDRQLTGRFYLLR